MIELDRDLLGAVNMKEFERVMAGCRENDNRQPAKITIDRRQPAIVWKDNSARDNRAQENGELIYLEDYRKEKEKTR
ncbi:MAG: hypothetical protein LBG04_02300 [Holosporaceae bacterium]|nr:hypothetical protein [Holosporaceae bacterium]